VPNNALLTDVAFATLRTTRQNANRWADETCRGAPPADAKRRSSFVIPARELSWYRHIINAFRRITTDLSISSGAGGATSTIGQERA
jgi:hypothetical protein